MKILIKNIHIIDSRFVYLIIIKFFNNICHLHFKFFKMFFVWLFGGLLDCSIWIRFELQGPLGGPAARIEFKCFVSAPFRKSSNGRKIARMARNLTIFGPNRSRRRELNFETNERANEQTNDLYKNFSKIFGGTPEGSRRPDLNYR